MLNANKVLPWSSAVKSKTTKNSVNWETAVQTQALQTGWAVYITCTALLYSIILQCSTVLYKM